MTQYAAGSSGDQQSFPAAVCLWAKLMFSGPGRSNGIADGLPCEPGCSALVPVGRTIVHNYGQLS